MFWKALDRVLLRLKESKSVFTNQHLSVARHFHHAPRKKVKGLLETLEALGLVERAGEEAFAA
jgi:DNA-binding IclR family transcriptional regulator